MTDIRSDDELLAEMKAKATAWREADERILEQHGGDPEAANRALGLGNQAEKWEEEALTSVALRDGTPARRIFDEVVGMDSIDRDAVYPPALTDDPETAT
ncbi:MAG: hypothetical protein F4029_08450 [Gammaproteobacteria bacterium]|nr:hypothetical protein [Gammaproteobacteria bacterium]MYF28606.1 hypothetical protein [Gammaproteobacteria bacterium]MYK46244.1 hypothetical protein [Gammaproteobacteria bacterium]